jgi:hypothetical protein
MLSLTCYFIFTPSPSMWLSLLTTTLTIIEFDYIVEVTGKMSHIIILITVAKKNPYNNEK